MGSFGRISRRLWLCLGEGLTQHQAYCTEAQDHHQDVQQAHDATRQYGRWNPVTRWDSIRCDWSVGQTNPQPQRLQ